MSKKSSGAKLSLPLLLILVVLAVLVFIFTPVENPLGTVETDGFAYDTALCLPANNGNIVYHPNYWLSYSEEHEQAQWVATVLRADNVLSPTVERSNNFIPDPDIPTGSALTSDYTGSGYDRGHILSFASNGWSQETGNASFYMSNMSPQAPNTNRYTYERLEEAERTATVQNGVLFVVHGPVLTDGPYETIGKANRISVPKQYFVCFLDYTGPEHKAIGFLIPNDNVNYPDITQFAVTVNQIEELTGLDLWYMLPPEEQELLESQCSPEDWDLSPFNRARVAAKYGYNLENLELQNIVYMQKEPQTPVEQILYFLYLNFAPIKIEILSLFV